MIVDITQLLSGQKETLVINNSVDNWMPEIDSDGPIIVEGTLREKNGTVYLDLRVKANVKATCSRCLEDFYHSLSLQIYEDLSLTDNLTLLKKTNLDLTELLRENILINIPIKPLCNEDCKGLCSVCGINKNYEECKCDNKDLDPRLSVLEDFFSEDE